MNNSENINIEEAKNVRETKRIGTFTFGITLILFGIIVILQTFAPFDLLRFVLMLWPIIFISIGIETLYYLWKKNVQIKYDLFGIILTLFLVFIGGIFSIGNYAVNKILYNEQIQNSIVLFSNNNTQRFSYSSNCIISNLSEKNVNVKIVENENINNTIYFSNKLKTSSDKTNLFWESILAQTQYNHIYISHEKDNTLTFCITKLPEYINSIDIIIYTNNIDSITTENCTII